IAIVPDDVAFSGAGAADHIAGTSNDRQDALGVAVNVVPVHPVVAGTRVKFQAAVGEVGVLNRDLRPKKGDTAAAGDFQLIEDALVALYSELGIVQRHLAHVGCGPSQNDGAIAETHIG